MQRKWFYYNKAIPKRKCFFILDLRKSDGTLCKQDSGAGSSLWSLRSASWEHCSTLVQHILDWQHILMGTKTLPSFSALLVWFFSFSAHLSSATIAWRLLGKKSLTHRTRPWAHAGVAESHWSNQCHWESKSQGHGTGCYNSNKTLTMQTCNQKSEISRYDMVSSDIIVATCHDSVSSHRMSFCMQLWNNGQVAWAIFHTDTYTLRTKTNCRPEDLEALQKSAGLASMLCMLFTVYQTLKCEALPWQR